MKSQNCVTADNAVKFRELGINGPNPNQLEPPHVGCYDFQTNKSMSARPLKRYRKGEIKPENR